MEDDKAQHRAATQASGSYRHVRDALGLGGAEDEAASGIIAPLLARAGANGPGEALGAAEAARRLSLPYLPETTFAIVDIETTGGRPPQHRVTELAALKVRAGEVVDSWDALVNPGREIPGNVVRLTGITDEMVADRPGLMEQLPGFLDFIEGCVFVAHCANFDFDFLRYYAEEFLERDFSPPVLCTFELANRLLPGQRRFNLGALGGLLGLGDWKGDRHRALGDARVTADIFIRFTRMCQLLGLESLDGLLAFQKPPEKPPPPMAKGVRLDPAEIDALPGERGVYRLYDGGRNLVFAGRANDVQRAVRDIFYPKNRTAARFALRLKEVRHVEAKVLRSELVMNVEAFRAMRGSRLINGSLSVAGVGFLRVPPTGAPPEISVAQRLLGDAGSYYGPFRKKTQLVDFLDAIAAAFPLRCEVPEGYRETGGRDGAKAGGGGASSKGGQGRQGRPRRLPALDEGTHEALFGLLRRILEGGVRKDDERAFTLLRDAWGKDAPSSGRLRRSIGRLHHLARTYALAGPSVERRRLIIIEPGETRAGRYCYFIRDGLLTDEMRFEKSAPPLDALRERIGEIFYGAFSEEQNGKMEGSLNERLEEGGVFAGWMRRELMDGFMLSLTGRASLDEVMEALTDALGDPRAAGSTITL